MSTLLDTNIITRLAQPADPLHKAALDAVAELRRRGEVPCIVPQNLYEFWVVATRPTSISRWRRSAAGDKMAMLRPLHR